ncbi:hypothetical protein Fot_35189 [Forsythia ovata]|uniref:Uncharacterized protein n=1 Tax=Forsythia ovata TaxID=205694 RepID=A0ABD1SKV5_9LAMI
MSNEFQLIREVSPRSTGWTVKVVVAEKFSPRIAQKSPTKYQNLILIESEADSSFFLDGEFEIVEEFKSWGHKNFEIIDDIVCEKYYLSSTPSKLFSKLSIPTDEKNFKEIRSIQGLKTVSYLVAELLGNYGLEIEGELWNSE